MEEPVTDAVMQAVSESSETKEMSAEEKAERLRRAEARIKERKKEIQEEDRKKEVEREKQRRQTGKDLVSIKAEMEWKEAHKIAQERKREKIEDRKVRQRIKEQIAKDREAMKLQKEKAETPTPLTSKPAAEMLSPVAKKDYNEAKLQIRLPSGSRLIQTFGAGEALGAVRLYVELNSTEELDPSFGLSVTFPRKVFSADEMEMSLKALGLVPSAVIQIIKKVT